MKRKPGEAGKGQPRKIFMSLVKQMLLWANHKESLWEVKQSSDMIRFLFQKDSHLTALGRMDCRDQDKKLGDPLEACGSFQVRNDMNLN